jgi:hypothetical protein
MLRDPETLCLTQKGRIERMDDETKAYLDRLSLAQSNLSARLEAMELRLGMDRTSLPPLPRDNQKAFASSTDALIERMMDGPAGRRFATETARKNLAAGIK